MKISGILFRRVRGFRVMDLAAMVIFLSLALTVYAFKTNAGAERSDIADVEDKIVAERHDVRLLQDQITRLENPRRLEGRARIAGEAPITAKQEVTPEALPQVAGPQLSGPPAASPTVASPPAVGPQVVAPGVAQ